MQLPAQRRGEPGWGCFAGRRGGYAADMNDSPVGFQEDWAAHFARRMAQRIAHAGRTRDLPARRDALEEALDLGKEARLRIQAGYTETAEESAALAHLQAALDEVQQLLNAIDPCYEPMLASAQAHAEAAADALNAAGR